MVTVGSAEAERLQVDDGLLPREVVGREAVNEDDGGVGLGSRGGGGEDDKGESEADERQRPRGGVRRLR